MKKSIYIVGFVLAGVALFQSCEEQQQAEPEKTSKLKMAEDSELALLMRQLTEETEAIREAVMAGETHPLWERVQELHTAIPTDPASSGPVFEGFSEAFIHAVREMESADSPGTKHFNAVVDQCMACHSTFCPGPKRRIAKFYISE